LYTVDKVPEGSEEWKYDVGYVNEAMIRHRLFPAAEGTICLMCGPPVMYERACVPNLLKVGYKEEDILAG